MNIDDPESFLQEKEIEALMKSLLKASLWRKRLFNEDLDMRIVGHWVVGSDRIDKLQYEHKKMKSKLESIGYIVGGEGNFIDRSPESVQECALGKSRAKTKELESEIERLRDIIREKDNQEDCFIRVKLPSVNDGEKLRKMLLNSMDYFVRCVNKK